MDILIIQAQLKEKLNWKNHICIDTLEEYLQANESEREDWTLGNYLVIWDDQKTWENCGSGCMSGAYVLEMENDEPVMYWLPYPEPTNTVGLDAIVEKLSTTITDYMNHINSKS